MRLALPSTSTCRAQAWSTRPTCCDTSWSAGPGPVDASPGAFCDARRITFWRKWRKSWERNAQLVAQELRRERLQAQVRADMVRALARHEPSVVHFDGEDITLQLTDHPNEDFAKSASTIDVLNYFVEMSEPTIPRSWSANQGPHKPPATSWYRNWRRHNKDLVCPERACLALRDYPPLSAGLHQPTALVTHAEEGLAPLPWPAGTLTIQLRVARKFFHHELGHGSKGDS